MTEENPLDKILSPSSIVIFGASENITTMGTYQLLNLRASGFPGRIYPVHPKLENIQGLKAYQSVLLLPEIPELALITIPPDQVLKVMDELGRKGTKRAIVISGGFKEIGEQGEEREKALKKIATQYGIRFLGPNCIGVLNPWNPLNITMYPYKQSPGYLSIASQSGTYVTQVLPYLEKFGIGYSKAISLGNEADIDVVDALEYLEKDERTKAIALYLEMIRRPREFIEIGKRVTKKKPVLVLFVGGTEAGARSGQSHTGAMAGSDEIHSACFKQAGMLRVPDVQSLFEWGFTLAMLPRLKGKRIGICTHSGGPATSLADACNRVGLDVPEFSEELQGKIKPFIPKTGSAKNPVDLTFSIDMEALYLKIPKLILESGEVDGLLLHGIGGESYYEDLQKLDNGMIKFPVKELAYYMKKIFTGLQELSKKLEIPIICSAFIGREDNAVAMVQDSGIPCFLTPERAVLAMRALLKDNVTPSINFQLPL